MDLKIIIEQLTVLFFIMAIGFLINKLGILNKEYNKCISKLLLTEYNGWASPSNTEK